MSAIRSFPSKTQLFPTTTSAPSGTVSVLRLQPRRGRYGCLRRPATGGPAFQSAEVNGKTLTMTFDQDLDGGSVPAPGRFTVTVGSARRNVASGGVAIDGATVELTLSTAVMAGETVKVRYTRGANPLRNAAGFAVASFGDPE